MGFSFPKPLASGRLRDPARDPIYSKKGFSVRNEKDHGAARYWLFAAFLPGLGRNEAADPGKTYVVLMITEHLASIQKAAAGLELSLEAFEAYLEDENNRPLYLATLSMVEALKHVYAADPDLLSAVNRTRVEEILKKETRGGKGRDSFNTGF
jgi:hypothetical protein